jgi:hypothetical protein
MTADLGTNKNTEFRSRQNIWRRIWERRKIQSSEIDKIYGGEVGSEEKYRVQK